MKIDLWDFSLLGKDSKLKACGLTADTIMSNIQSEQFNESKMEAELERRALEHPETCQCHECQDARETQESDDYDLKTCHTV